jgi:hypothetical protein
MRSKLVYLGLILLLATLSGCTLTPAEEISWVVDSHGWFHTTYLERAQQEMPFTIIVPTYLPDDLDPYKPYMIDGTVKNASENENMEVRISYGPGGEQIIEVFENSQTIIMLPTPEFNPVYLDIAGIQVLQQEDYLYGETIIEGLSFDWNQGGLTFSVSVFSYSQDEAIKIVESMIEQIE